MEKELLIIGSKSTALEIYDVVINHIQNEYSKIVFVIGDKETMCNSFSYIKDSDITKYVENNNKYYYIISFANHNLRVKFENLLNSYGMTPINVIHPSAIISKSATIGLGNYIAANCVISYNAKIKNHNVINFNSTIGHDTIINNHCTINPGARISGNVEIGERVLIGSNSVIFQGVKIGSDCLIDALTYIDRNIESKMICSSKKLEIFKRVI